MRYLDPGTVVRNCQFCYQYGKRPFQGKFTNFIDILKCKIVDTNFAWRSGRRFTVGKPCSIGARSHALTTMKIQFMSPGLKDLPKFNESSAGCPGLEQFQNV